MKYAATILVFFIGINIANAQFAKNNAIYLDIPVILTPHSGDTDPSRFLGQKDKNVTNLQFFS